VHDDFPRDTRNLGRAPCKHVPIALEEVDELTFLFGVQTDLNLHGFGWVPSIDLHGLGILVRLQNAGHRGYHQTERRCGQLEVELP
jgi:hypothetical protein